MEERAARVAALHERATAYAVSRPLLARVWRTVARYVEVRVPRMSAFVTYYGFLALFPLTALGFAVLGLLSRYVPRLDDAVIDAINDNTVSGLSPDILEQLQRAAVGLGLISLVLLLYAGVRAVEALREAMALVFGGAPPRGRLVQRIGADLVLLVLCGLVLLASIVLSAVTTTSAGWVADRIPVTSEWLVRVAALAGSLLITTVLFALVMWRLAGRPVRSQVLWRGALVGAVGMEVLHSAATYVIGGALKNPVYGVFALTIGMLIWINLAAKLLLVVAAWVAVADDDGLGVPFLGSAGPAGGGDEALPAAGLATPAPDRQHRDHATGDEQGQPHPGG